MAIRKISDSMSPSLRRIQSELAKLPAEAFNVFVKTTPKRTGNARRRTRLQSNRTIVANYAYADRLDQGASRQAPQGMSKPTKKYIQQRLNKIMRK
jgi:hypothetical protein